MALTDGNRFDASKEHVNTPMPAQTPIQRMSAPPTRPHENSDGIQRHSAQGAELVVVTKGSVAELHLTVTPIENEPPPVLVRRTAGMLAAWKATIVRQIAFGSVKAHQETLTALRQVFGDPDLPLIWVEGASCSSNPIAGIQVHAVAGAQVRTLECDNDTSALVWDDPQMRQCIISIGGPDSNENPTLEQTAQAFRNIQLALGRAGMTMNDLARTWFFLDDIIPRYEKFNSIRNDTFARSELRAGYVPASTGVGGRNPARNAVSAVAWAVQPHEGKDASVRAVPSPMQCAAPSYGSAFSRAVELAGDGFCQLLVSGTASIAPDGRTVHVGDILAQIELTMQVVRGILESRQMTFADVIRATAYFKFPKDAPLFLEWLVQRGLSAMPVVCTNCEICRNDLLFEIELDVIRQVQPTSVRQAQSLAKGTMDKQG